MSNENGHAAHPASIMPEIMRETKEFITVHQLQHLVRMFDQSDTIELEVRDAAMNARLLLRKSEPLKETTATITLEEGNTSQPPTRTQYTVTASFVGIFHLRSPAKQPLQMLVGNKVKEGQHLGSIQSLNILNEVESPIAGRIVALLIEDGQPVEFGQPLLIIEPQ